MKRDLTRTTSTLLAAVVGAAWLGACGSPIPDEFPALDDKILKHITFSIDGESYRCRDGGTAQSGSAGITFFTVCEEGSLRIVIGSTDEISVKDIECGTDNTLELRFDSSATTQCVDGKIEVAGFESEYAWGRFWGEHPRGTITDGMYSLKHEDRGHAKVE